MKNSNEQMDEVLRRNVAPEGMNEAEAEAVWQQIEDGADAGATTARSRRRSFRSRRVYVPVVAALGVALVVIAFVAAPGKQGEDGSASFALTKLDSASASEVLGLTARSAGKQPSLVPGGDQVLYSKVVQIVDEPQFGDGATGIQRYELEEWIGPDGRGVRVDGYAAAGIDSSGNVTRSDPNATFFDVGDSRDPEVTHGDSWRAIFSLKDLEKIPTDSEQALSYLRQSLQRAMAGSDDLTRVQASSLGQDFNVFMLLSRLLFEAPLTGQQRAALFQLAAEAPEWVRTGQGPAARVENLGATKLQDGRSGILVSISLELTKAEARLVTGGHQAVSFGIVLEPQAGSLLESRVNLGETDEPAFRFVSEALELRGRSDLPVALP